MSGHSKWSTIKHQKQATDAARGQVFTKLGNAITIAVKEGGGADPSSNFKLRLAIDRAKNVNMPKENIERAITKALGKNTEGNLEEVVYEGFGPRGIAVLAVGVTDNKQRTAQEVKNIFSRHGGNLSGSGSVSFLFKHLGLITISKNNIDSNELLNQISAINADNIEEDATNYLIYTKPQDLHRSREYLLQHKYDLGESELVYKPNVSIKITEETVARQIVALLEALENLADIHKVFSNSEITI